MTQKEQTRLQVLNSVLADQVPVCQAAEVLGVSERRISCAEARNHGIAPVRRGHPAYQYMNDADNDGVVCE